VRELERIAELGVMLPVARVIHATNSPLGVPPNPGVAEHYRKALPGALAVLESVLADGRPFLAGERPTIADCTLAAALQFGRFRKIELDPAFGHLARWDRAYRERAPAKAVLVV
jgi:glutathione S-transferase